MPTDRNVTKKESQIYAQALLEAAQGEGTVFEVAGQVLEVLQTIRGSIDLHQALYDATLDAQARKQVIAELFKDSDPALISTLGVMVDRDDLDLLPRVTERYIELAEDALNATIIDVTTVVALDDELRKQIISKYSAEFGRGVLLREHVDPSIIGGIVLSTHGRRIDASIVSQLESARNVLSTVTSGGER
jgi:F-type H+-transporting ATPase subunit delta